MGSNQYFLADDITTDILLRLPVKSLLRFKVVSKHWFSLLTSSNFINTLYQKPSNQKLSVILRMHRHKYSDSYCLSMLRDGIDRVDHTNMPLDIDWGDYGAKIVGSSNGLICLRIEFYWNNESMCYILWNPATRQYRRLPSSSKNHPFVCARGFGFHPQLNDYKLLQVTYKNMELNGHEAEVFTFGTDSWRKVKDVPIYDYNLSNQVVIRGMWYHLTLSGSRSFILTFDMGDDTFSKVKAALPCTSIDHDIDYFNIVMELLEYKESLAICRYDIGMDIPFRFDIWVMEEESWRKLFICSSESFPKNLTFLPALGFCSDENIVMELYRSQSKRKSDIGLCLFDPSTEKSKMLVVDGACWIGRRTHNYMESMVSVHVTKYQDVNFSN